MMVRKPDRPEGCPSDFAFDWQLLGELEGEEKRALESHFAECERCTKRFAALTREADAWKKSAPPRRLPRARAQGWPWVAGAIALAACLVLFVRTKGPGSQGYVGTKGTPAVELLLHRQGETRIWDGHAPLRPGDALALRVACESLDHLIVAAPATEAPSPSKRLAGFGTRKVWQRLSDGTCPSQGEPLPFTLVVDDEPGDERLAVVLSQEEMDDVALQRAIASDARTADVWVVKFILPKETGPER